MRKADQDLVPPPTEHDEYMQRPLSEDEIPY